MLSLNDFKNELMLKTAASSSPEARIKRGCAKSAKELKKTASKLALNMSKYGHECVSFLKEHVVRTNSPAARTMLEAIRNMSPQITDADFHPSSTAVIDSLKGNQEEPLMAPEVTEEESDKVASPEIVAPTTSLSPMAEKVADEELASLQNWASSLDKSTLSKLQGIWNITQSNEGTPKQAKVKKVAKYGMYGCNPTAAKLALDAMSELRGAAGVLAADNLIENGNHASITACYKQAHDEGCQASNLLASCMPGEGWTAG